MTNILLINPNQWGRGITHLWICSHSALLKNNGHNVDLFDATFYSDWSKDETAFNTKNGQYQPTNYDSYLIKKNGIKKDLQEIIKLKNPNLILVGGISSHINGEGEYINIELANILLQDIEHNAIVCSGGIQPTASFEYCLDKYLNIDVMLHGDSEFSFLEIANLEEPSFENISKIAGTALRSFSVSKKRERINLQKIPPYDYDIFSKQVFYRPYNGQVLKAADYELSRGCIFSCAYCVETVIQSYLGHHETTKMGVLKAFNQYIAVKSLNNVKEEFQNFEKLGIEMLRCQDTNFLTIPRPFLNELSNFIDSSDISIGLYIETRPETISPSTITLLKKLNVIGVGMGVETAAEDYREGDLDRFSSYEKIVRAFKLLKEAGIKRTSYNILGMPGQSENDILSTIEFNKLINPDNITVSYYSPYMGTKTALKGSESNEYKDNSSLSDAQLRSNTLSQNLDKNKLDYYKNNFNSLCRS